jgi:hypothetical protein
MGLDISAYSHIKVLENVLFDEDGDPVDENGKLLSVDKCFQPWINPHYPKHAGNINDKSAYGYEQTFGFRAGSYSGYNRWRNSLAQLAGYRSAEDVWNNPGLEGPFVELINFSDCEGVIGPEVSAKLSKDFADFDAQASNFQADPNGYFYHLYLQWKVAFELAAQDGAVEFH